MILLITTCVVNIKKHMKVLAIDTDICIILYDNARDSIKGFRRRNINGLNNFIMWYHITMKYAHLFRFLNR